MGQTVNNILIVLLTILGLSQSFFHWIGFEPARYLASLTVATPLPLVFNTYLGHEYWSSEYYVAYRYNDDEQVRKILAPDYGRVDAPHLLKMNIMATVAFSGVINPEYYSRSLRFQICDSGVLGKALGIPSDIDEFSIITMGRPGRDQFVAEVEFQCDI